MLYTIDYKDYLTPEIVKRFRWTYAYWSRLHNWDQDKMGAILQQPFSNELYN